MKIYKLKESCYNIATCSDSTFLIKNNDDFYKIDKKVFKEIININDLIFIREIKDNIFNYGFNDMHNYIYRVCLFFFCCIYNYGYEFFVCKFDTPWKYPTA